jgi:hypothetical protein
MPVMRSLYEREADRFVDAVDPFRDASAPTHPVTGSRSVLAVLFSSMAIDCGDALRGAWAAIASHPAYPRERGGLVLAEDVADAGLRAMLERFDAMPAVPTPDGPIDLGDPSAPASVESGWIRGGWSGEGLWHPEDRPVEALRALWTPFFEANYRWVQLQETP